MRSPAVRPFACSAPASLRSLTPLLLLALGAAIAGGADAPGGRAARLATLFEDPFDDKLADGWAWVRPVEGAATFAGGVLRVRPSSGTLWETDNTGTNVLVRPAPAGQASYAFEVTVAPATGAKDPGLYEQAGLVWYVDDDNYVKLLREFYDGRWWVVLASERKGKAEYAQAPLDADAVRLRLRLRLTIAGGRAAGAFTEPTGGEWREAGAFELPAGDKPRIGLLAQTGPDAPERHIGFDDFAVRRLPGS